MIPYQKWYKRFDMFMLSNGFLRSKYDSCVYCNSLRNEKQVILLLYVDDMLIASKSSGKIEDIKTKLKSEFEMNDLGQVSRILGIYITRERRTCQMFLSHQTYLEKILLKYGMSQARPVPIPLSAQFKLSKTQAPKIDEKDQQMMEIPYANIVGSIMYSMVCSRPDLAYALSIVSRFISNSRITHWHVVKGLMRYIKGCVKKGIAYYKKQVSTRKS